MQFSESLFSTGKIRIHAFRGVHPLHTKGVGGLACRCSLKVNTLDAINLQYSLGTQWVSLCLHSKSQLWDAVTLFSLMGHSGHFFTVTAVDTGAVFNLSIMGYVVHPSTVIAVETVTLLLP